ncbi:dynamin family protein, partial [Paenibacillus lemnae]|nr:dynamin [Paenibacillus lemnae]
MKVVTEVETGFTSGQLQQAIQQFTEWNDESSAALTKDLLAKQAAGELTLAFCGHFSAGKSSMINALCGTKVLPSGPVPTSANVVTIRNGSPRASIHRAGGGTESSLNVTTQELAEYCRNGGEYSSIDVWEDIPWLGKHGVLMDTPGVDSTDDGHRKATHSALHMADVVFYVMDYNHVQSESNLMFAKSLSDWGKPLYLIVNQIDKHRDDELSLTSYLSDVNKAFEQWKVQYSGLMCISLKEHEHPYNQWADLKSLLSALLENRDTLLEYSVACSLRHVTESHAEQFIRSHQEEKDALLEEIGGEEAIHALQIRVQEQENKWNEAREYPDTLASDLRKEADALLGNANLMPADVRDLALSWLESRKSGFKVGFLFSAGKTEEEKNRRLELFVNRLKQQMSSQVDFHLRTLWREMVERTAAWDDAWEQALDNVLPSLNEEMLIRSTDTQAVLSGEYVLNYCKRLAEDIKAGYRRAVAELAERLRTAAADKNTVRLAELERQHAELLAQSAASARHAALQQAEAARTRAAAALAPPHTPLTPGLLPEVREPAALPQAAA